MWSRGVRRSILTDRGPTGGPWPRPSGRGMEQAVRTRTDLKLVKVVGELGLDRVEGRVGVEALELERVALQVVELRLARRELGVHVPLCPDRLEPGPPHLRPAERAGFLDQQLAPLLQLGLLGEGDQR